MKNNPRKDVERKVQQNIVHNFSTYSLSHEPYKALSFGLDTQIPAKVNQSTIYTELEVFFQSC